MDRAKLQEISTRSPNGYLNNLKTRERQVSASQETTNLGLRALDNRSSAWTALPKGSVGPGAVLLCALVGVLGAVSVSTLLFYWDAAHG